MFINFPPLNLSTTSCMSLVDPVPQSWDEKLSSVNLAIIQVSTHTPKSRMGKNSWFLLKKFQFEFLNSISCNQSFLINKTDFPFISLGNPLIFPLRRMRNIFLARIMGYAGDSSRPKKGLRHSVTFSSSFHIACKYFAFQIAYAASFVPLWVLDFSPAYVNWCFSSHSKQPDQSAHFPTGLTGKEVLRHRKDHLKKT